MMFVLRMAWRETRASWARLLFFFVCVAVGVGSIVTIRSVVQHIRVALVGEARELVGADLIVRSRGAWAAETRAGVADLLSQPAVRARSEMVETQTMLSTEALEGAGAARLVDVRGVEGGYPFYGTIELEDGRPYAHALLADHGMLVQPSVLIALGVTAGDRVRLGGALFTIRGVVTRDRVQRTGLAFGPRVYVDLADLRETDLLGFGSMAAHAILAQVDEDRIDALSRGLRRRYRRDGVTVSSWRSLEDRLGRNLTIAENHLSLVGFAVLVLGGIGVWSVTRVLVQQKMKSVAILKCLGATSHQVFGTYLIQIGWLSLGGGVLGLGLSVVALALIPAGLVEPLGVRSLSLTGSASVQGLLVGLLVSFVFAVVPLLEVRLVKPLLLLRADTASTARRRTWQSWIAALAAAGALVLVAVWQAGSLEAGVYVTGGLAVVGAALMGASRLLIRAVAPLARSSRFALRHAVVSLGRPGNQTRMILMAVGLGCFFVLAVRSVQANLLEEFSLQLGTDTPDMVLIDIQPDQVDRLGAVIAPYIESPTSLMPLMRARVVGVEGQDVQLRGREALREAGVLQREYGLTFRSTLDENEQVLDGEFWTAPLLVAQLPGGLDTEVSIEQDVSVRPGVRIGDILQFDVSGQPLNARVTSVRSVAWNESLNGGFVFVLRPGPAVERLAHTFIGFVDAAEDPVRRGALQRDLVRAFPNVSAIDVREVLTALREIVDSVTFGVTIVGAVTLGSGMLILVGAVALTKFQRLYESAIYRTLGASARLIATMVTIEYTLLGALAGVLGATGALGLSWAMAWGVFDIVWEPAPGLLAIGVVVTAVAVGAVGLAASVDVLVRKPLATLRRE